jgi:hypothetical protein
MRCVAMLADGPNSIQLLELERQDENYCLLGHSHGGSVVANALLHASKKGYPLYHLRRWITVGTPYIETRRRFALFSRLRPWARAGHRLQHRWYDSGIYLGASSAAIYSRSSSLAPGKALSRSMIRFVAARSVLTTLLPGQAPGGGWSKRPPTRQGPPG